MGTRETVVKILEEIGWQNNFAIPVLNEKNKKLMKETDGYTDRVQQMIDHSKNVSHELREMDAILAVSRRDIEGEEHLEKIQKIEIDRMNQDISRFNRQIVEMEAKNKQYEDFEIKCRAQIDELRLGMKVDNKTLEAWLQEAESREEDLFVLDKYKQKDTNKIKELRLNIQRLNAEAMHKKNVLQDRITHTRTNNIQIDKALEELGQFKTQRKNLLSKWEGTVNFLKTRDANIDHLKTEVNAAKNVAREKENEIRETIRFLNEQHSNATEMERKIQDIETFLSQLKLQVVSNEKSLVDFKSEMESLKRQTDRTAQELDKVRKTVTYYKKEKIRRTEKISELQSARGELVKKLELLESNTMSTEQMAKESEARHKAEEEALKNHHQLMQKLRDEQFKKSQEVFQSTHDLKTLQNTLISCRNLLKTLNSKLEKIDQNILRQQEIIYNQDYAIQQFERRIGRMKGEIKEEDRTAHEAQLKTLDAELHLSVKSLEGMRNQLEASESDLRRVKRDIIKIKKDEEQVQTLLKTQDVQLESCEKELVKLKADRKEKLVEKNMLEVDVEQLKKAQEKNMSICTDVEKDRSQLDSSLKLKMKEIESYEQMQKSEQNTVSQENSNLRMEIQSRNSRIEKLMNRYEILNYSMMGAAGMEEDHTQAYYVIKAAQEREALQRHGDKLDAEIRKLERETHAMQNTLDVMKGCNQAFRQGHKIVDQSSEEMKELQEAQEVFKNQFALLKTTKTQFKELSDNCQTLKETLALLSRDSDLFDSQLENLKREEKTRQADVDKMSERLQRTLDSLGKLKRKCTVKFDESKREKTKRDIEIRTMADFLENMAKELIYRLQTRYLTDVQEVAEIQLRNADFKLSTIPASKSCKRDLASDDRLSISTPSTISLSMESSLSSARSDRS